MADRVPFLRERPLFFILYEKDDAFLHKLQNQCGKFAVCAIYFGEKRG